MANRDSRGDAAGVARNVAQVANRAEAEAGNGADAVGVTRAGPMERQRQSIRARGEDPLRPRAHRSRGIPLRHVGPHPALRALSTTPRRMSVNPDEDLGAHGRDDATVRGIFLAAGLGALCWGGVLMALLASSGSLGG